MPTTQELKDGVNAALENIVPANYQNIKDRVEELDYSWDKFTEAEQSCISRKISRLSDEGKSDDQTIAIAIATCAPTKANQRDFALFARYQKALEDPGDVEIDPAPDASDFVNTQGLVKIPHGGYTSRQRPNEHWDVFDVPSFAEHVRVFAFGQVVVVDKEFQEQMVRESQRKLLEDKTMMPLKVHHCGGGPADPIPIFAGFHVLRRVALFRINGQEVWTTFADYINMPPWVYEEFKAIKLPYRSVEMSDPDKPQIDAIALLDTDASFFDLPMGGIGQEFPHELVPENELAMTEMAGFSKERETVYTYKEGAALCYRRVGNRSMVLFRIEKGGNMSWSRFSDRLQSLKEDKDITTEELTESVNKNLKGTIDESTIGQILRGEIKTPSDPVIGALAKALSVSKDSLLSLLGKESEPEEEGRFSKNRRRKNMPKRKRYKDHEDEENDDINMQREDEEGDGVNNDLHGDDENREEKSEVKTEKTGKNIDIDVVRGMFKSLLSAFEALFGEEAEEEKVEEKEEVGDDVPDDILPDVPADQRKVEAKRMSDRVADAEVAAQNMTYRKENARLKSDLSIVDKVRNASSELKKSGVSIDATDEKELTKYAKQGDEPLRAFVDTMKKLSPAVPPTTFSGELPSAGNATCKEVDVYSKYGPDFREGAEGSAAAYHAQPEHFRVRTSLETWLATDFSSTKFASYMTNGAAAQSR